MPVVASPDLSPADNVLDYPVDVLQVSDLLMAANCSTVESAFSLVNQGPSDCSAYSLVIRPGTNPGV